MNKLVKMTGTELYIRQNNGSLLSWNTPYVPVVMRADMIIAGDQSGWNDLTYAAAPLACGHAMDVPEMMLY
jgi:hypothetical protein